MNNMPPASSIVAGTPTAAGGGGKAARAKAARRGQTVVTDLSSHRACGSGPIASDLDATASGSDQAAVVKALERIETAARTRHRPHLTQRREVPMDNHGSMIVPAAASSSVSSTNGPKPEHLRMARKADGHASIGSCSCCDLSERGLRGELFLERITEFLDPPAHASLASIVQLNLSRNELWDLPPLTALSGLRHLDLSRNWFAALPWSIVDLGGTLRTLDVSHNMLRSSQAALLIAGSDASSSISRDTGTIICALQSLAHLQVLDLRFNQKCGHQKLLDKLRRILPPATDVRMTISFPPPEGAFVGGSAAERDPTLLRSQLEPWPTTALRRRLVADFGEEPSCPETFTRADVMGRLLDLYEEELNDRTVVRVEGTPVDENILRDLRAALADWRQGWNDGNQERVSINAENYMILTSPASWTELGLKKRAKAAAKLEKHRKVWELAQAAMTSVDAEFASSYTALAVTHNFRGSPHIDKQNLAPFYGLSVGDFEDGTGGVMVECSARVLAHVNTKNRLGKVDGRYPHWVVPYDEEKDRYSLIFYQTMGRSFQPPGAAIFCVPKG